MPYNMDDGVEQGGVFCDMGAKGSTVGRGRSGDVPEKLSLQGEGELQAGEDHAAHSS